MKAHNRMIGPYKKIYYTQVYFLHLIHAAILYLNIFFQCVYRLIPLLYFMIVLGNISVFMQMDVLTKNYMTATSYKKMESLGALKLLSIVIMVSNVLMGLIPVPGYGSLCVDGNLIYPLAFYTLMVNSILSMVVIRHQLKNKDILKLKNRKLTEFYKSALSRSALSSSALSKSGASIIDNSPAINVDGLEVGAESGDLRGQTGQFGYLQGRKSLEEKEKAEEEVGAPQSFDDSVNLLKTKTKEEREEANLSVIEEVEDNGLDTKVTSGSRKGEGNPKVRFTEEGVLQIDEEAVEVQILEENSLNFKAPLLAEQEGGGQGELPHLQDMSMSRTRGEMTQVEVMQLIKRQK
eukprot:CAMPEP_0168616540 /NCGR_PEP_ID=MMETSP0449_2-20121227/5079_1 /TAXON_ID=1082188 /ORGANISM="Strombidium rassoulzadegani, Strain ras09" /LENGTH=348 /DNA_ID=CAMNT_0008657327 /DNA_START=119 /DNA_END=1165 /DNA_ORIENTATION=+